MNIHSKDLNKNIAIAQLEMRIFSLDPDVTIYSGDHNTYTGKRYNIWFEIRNIHVKKKCN